MKTFIYSLTFSCLVCLALPAGTAVAESVKSTNAPSPPPAGTPVFNGTLYEAVASNPQLSSFMTALNEAGLAPALKGKGPLSVYAPDNEAFSKLPEGMFDNLMNAPDQTPLKTMLSRYIVPGRFLSADLTKNTLPLTPLSGQTTALKRTPEGILFNGSLLTAPDIQTKNGVLNIVSSINPPPPPVKTAPPPEKSAPGAAKTPAPHPANPSLKQP